MKTLQQEINKIKSIIVLNEQYEGDVFYHGSPYKFDRFDLSKVGTGDGLNKYGFGLYFADNIETARYYANELSIGSLKETGFNIYVVKLYNLNQFYQWEEETPMDVAECVMRKLNKMGKTHDAELMNQEYEEYGTMWSVRSLYEILSDILGGAKQTTEFLYTCGMNGVIAQSPIHEGDVYVVFDDDLIKIIDIQDPDSIEEGMPDTTPNTTSSFSSSSSTGGGTGSNTTAPRTKWESGVARGKANTIDQNSVWNSDLTRGKANPVNEQIIRMSEMMGIEEDPDDTRGLGSLGPVDYHNSKAFGFGYYEGVMWVSDPGQTHGSADASKTNVRSKMDSPGRFWTHHNIISFWNMKGGRSLRTVIDDLNEALKIKYPHIKIDDNWNISICKFNLVKSGLWQAESYIPLGQCIKELGSKSYTDAYTISWDDAHSKGLWESKQIGRILEIINMSEDPDKLRINGGKAWYSSEEQNARGFGYLNDKIIFTKVGDNHTEFNYNDVPVHSRDDLESAGRIFSKERVLTFWRLDGRSMETIINDINNGLIELGETDNPINNSWRVSACQYSLIRHNGVPYSEVFKPISEVIPEIGSRDDTTEYTISWDKAYKYRSY